MRSSALLAAAAAIGLAACNQQATPSDAETAAVATEEPAAPADPAAPATTAADFVRMAAVSDMFEIESSRLALEKSDDPAVERFAQQMIGEHTRASETLKSTVREMGGTVTVPTELDAPHAAKLAALRGLSGAAFDRMYWQEQRTAHDAALALHRGYASGGDTAELRTIATNMVPIVEGHRRMVMQAMGGGETGAAMDGDRSMSGGSATGGNGATGSTGSMSGDATKTN